MLVIILNVRLNFFIVTVFVCQMSVDLIEHNNFYSEFDIVVSVVNSCSSCMSAVLRPVFYTVPVCIVFTIFSF